MIVVIPARGGSKRIPGKNITRLNGKPLLTYTIEAVLNSGIDAPVYVSTEADDIAEIARESGAEVIDRPEELAADAASTESAVLHALDETGRDDEWVMILPPTSPFRRPETIKKFHDRVQNNNDDDVDCFMSVTETKGDFWRFDKDGNFGRLFPDAPRRQQDRDPLYEEDSAIYVCRVSALRETNIVLGNKTQGIPIDFPEGFDINTPEDLILAEALIKASQ